MSNPEYLTPANLAERYNVSRVTIWSWAKKGKLPKPIQTTAGNMWKHQALDRWDAAQAAKQAKK